MLYKRVTRDIGLLVCFQVGQTLVDTCIRVYTVDFQKSVVTYRREKLEIQRIRVIEVVLVFKRYSVLFRTQAIIKAVLQQIPR